MIKGGIAQGASLSSLLCEVYYSAMCKRHLSKFNFDSNVLFRAVDDFLYITFDQDLAAQFLQFMQQGIKDFNCNINPSKTKHNLDGQNKRISFKGKLSTLKRIVLN